jgi:hypothetical protein
MNPSARDEIFGQLRDAYDGQFKKVYGNGVVREYNCHFGIIAGVTPNIDAYASLHQGLGERFLKLRLEGSTRHLDEKERILRAIGNVTLEIEMRAELQKATAIFLESKTAKHLPHINDGIRQRIVSLAMLTARMRGVVMRDKFNPQHQIIKPSYEVGTRLGKQLSKLAMGVAIVKDEKDVSEESYGAAARTALSSITDKVEEVVRVLWEKRKSGIESLSTKDISHGGRGLSTPTVFRVLQDLQLLEIVRQVGTDVRYRWKLSKGTIQLLEDSRVYELVPRM